MIQNKALKLIAMFSREGCDADCWRYSTWGHRPDIFTLYLAAIVFAMAHGSGLSCHFRAFPAEYTMRACIKECGHDKASCHRYPCRGSRNIACVGL